MSRHLPDQTISALFGLTNHIIGREHYTILVTAVSLGAVVPTLIAERWFQPEFRLREEQPAEAGQWYRGSMRDRPAG